MYMTSKFIDSVFDSFMNPTRYIVISDKTMQEIQDRQRIFALKRIDEQIETLQAYRGKVEDYYNALPSPQEKE